ncbi:ATP-binding cassette domain-containing protein [Mycobacterium sp. NAZ190054]|uniref:ATP-binding cassette domain-containing protein n=1 Tax=Mycobacterium sp. NAZ190054 TaxID=1747766 RepID=UPI0009E98CD1
MSSVRVRARLDRRAADFDLSLADGEVLAVLGPNGAGKSSLLHLIAGLLRPDDGRIELGGSVVVDTAAGTFVPAHARRVAMLNQQALLFPHMTAEANVAYAPRCRGFPRGQARASARRWLAAVGAAELAGRGGRESGGGGERGDIGGRRVSKKKKERR